MEAAVETFELEACDVDEAVPLAPGGPPQRERADPFEASAAGDVDPAVRRHVGHDLPASAGLVDALSVEGCRETCAERKDVPREPPARQQRRRDALEHRAPITPCREVEHRTERADHELDLLVDAELTHVAFMEFHRQ